MYACAVFDKKVNAYMYPQFFRTKGEATRSFMDAVGAEAAPFRKHAEDYVFCYLGQYDDNTGQFENAPGNLPEILMTAMDCLTIDGAVN
ncbi:nonstructural protein [Apis mellifera associated microvirus 7]|nr:nonstructural protein [Apis mellifera associated microvirus 7]